MHTMQANNLASNIWLLAFTVKWIGSFGTTPQELKTPHLVSDLDWGA